MQQHSRAASLRVQVGGPAQESQDDAEILPTPPKQRPNEADVYEGERNADGLPHGSALPKPTAQPTQINTSRRYVSR